MADALAAAAAPAPGIDPAAQEMTPERRLRQVRTILAHASCIPPHVPLCEWNLVAEPHK